MIDPLHPPLLAPPKIQHAVAHTHLELNRCTFIDRAGPPAWLSTMRLQHHSTAVITYIPRSSDRHQQEASQRFFYTMTCHALSSCKSNNNNNNTFDRLVFYRALVYTAFISRLELGATPFTRDFRGGHKRFFSTPFTSTEPSAATNDARLCGGRGSVRR